MTSKPKKRVFEPTRLKKINVEPVTPLYEKYNLTRNTTIKGADNQDYEFNYEDIKEFKLIGEGAFGAVFKIHHTKSNMMLAIKRVDGKKLDEQNNFNKDIMGDYWIISELMDTSMDFFNAKAKENKILISELFLSKLSYAVLSALVYLKSKGYMHRDIKPSNILLNRTGEVKVCDFGISGKINQSICMTVGRGCRPYMAPEKIDEQLYESGYTVKSDVWSLGITLVEIADVHPYINLEYVQQIIKIVKENPPQLDSTKHSKLFCDFVDLCLKKNVNERLNPDELNQNEFIKKYENEANDLELINKIIDLLSNEPMSSD